MLNASGGARTPAPRSRAGTFRVMGGLLNPLEKELDSLRSAIQRALRQGDALVVWKLDRLGRHLARPVNTVQDLSPAGWACA